MQKDFSNFEIEDFAFDESFRQWVSESDPESQRFWDLYLKQHPYQTDKILAARALVEELTSIDYHENTELVSSIWSNVQDRINPKPRVIWRRIPVFYAAASIVILIMGISGYLFLHNGKPRTDYLPITLSKSGNIQLVEDVNSTNKTVRIYLSDGSVVSLGKDSRLIYPKSFKEKERVVHLIGEAFFEVKRNPNKPFLIYANETVTKVLGTSFRIMAYVQSPKVIVAVSTGKVSVFNKKDFDKDPKNLTPAGIVLTANQQAEFLRKQEQFSKTLVEEPKVINGSSTHPFDFDNVALEDVFAVLEKAYGVEIVYDSDLVKNRFLKVSLEDESLHDKLRVICGTMGFTYQIVDAKIIIEKNN